MSQGSERANATGERAGAGTDKRSPADDPQRRGGRNAPASQASGESAGSRTGTALGSADQRTGPGDADVPAPSQGVTGAQGDGGRPDASAPGARHAESPGDREERIRQAEYRRHTERGGVPGQDVDDWLAAEAEDGQGAKPS